MRTRTIVAVLVCMIAAAVRAGLIDSRDSIDARVQMKGDVAIVDTGDFVGGHDMRRKASEMRTKGSAISFELKAEAQKPITIEIEEIDGRERDVRGYLVYVNGVKTYLRTFRGCGAGPVHYFVQVPANEKDRVTLRLENACDVPFRIGRVWVYSDFEKYFDEAGMAVPYFIAPTVPVNGRDREKELAKIATIKQSLGEHPNVKPAWTTWIAYAALEEEQVRRRIDYVLSLAKESQMPVQVCFDSWWGHTPKGPDGKGGRWSDEKYQQVIYNATKGTFELSIPNRWSNTPWLSVSQPELNAFKAQCAKMAAEHLKMRYRELLAQGKQSLVLAVNLDNEPVYWASGNAALGDEIKWADFNASAVESAKRDSVTLDPTDGLSREERLWLWKNLLNYNRLIGSSVVEGLGRDAGDNPLCDNVYTQAMMMTDAALQYPMMDRAYPLWETAAPAEVRVGGEWHADSVWMREEVMHQLPLGRNASINAECSNDERENRGVMPGYALGQRFYAPYNYPLDKMDVATSQLRDLAAAFTPFEYQPVLAEYQFDLEGKWQAAVASHKGVGTRVIGNTAAVALYPAASGRPGYVSYLVKRAGDGLAIELDGRAKVFSGAAGKHVEIRVLAGEYDNAMSVVATITDEERFLKRIDLSSVAPGKDFLRVRIELASTNLADDLRDWCAIWGVRFVQPWPAELKNSLPKQDESLATVRKQNLVVSWRRDAELAITKIPLEARREAQDLYDRGDYARAYRIANQSFRDASKGE